MDDLRCYGNRGTLQLGENTALTVSANEKVNIRSQVPCPFPRTGPPARTGETPPTWWPPDGVRHRLGLPGQSLRSRGPCLSVLGTRSPSPLPRPRRAHGPCSPESEGGGRPCRRPAAAAPAPCPLRGLLTGDKRPTETAVTAANHKPGTRVHTEAASGPWKTATAREQGVRCAPCRRAAGRRQQGTYTAKGPGPRRPVGPRTHQGSTGGKRHPCQSPRHPCDGAGGYDRLPTPPGRGSRSPGRVSVRNAHDTQTHCGSSGQTRLQSGAMCPNCHC